jgi:hypothetical protein
MIKVKNFTLNKPKLSNRFYKFYENGEKSKKIRYNPLSIE